VRDAGSRPGTSCKDKSTAHTARCRPARIRDAARLAARRRSRG
jgi:hypothetical protein